MTTQQLNKVIIITAAAILAGGIAVFWITGLEPRDDPPVTIPADPSESAFQVVEPEVPADLSVQPSRPSPGTGEPKGDQ